MELTWDEEKRRANIINHGFASFPYERQQEMSKKSTSMGSQTEWERIKAMSDEDIDTSEVS